ncbi:hypothetical protein Q3G72_003790 [Acer saccharum]|nr:hypothetical protein Q3G72_003790 [Acer saccharum]
MEVVCGSTAVEPPMSPRSPPGGGLDLYGKGDRWLKFRGFLFKGFLSDEECDCVTTLLIWQRTSLRSQWWQIMSPVRV